MASVQFFRRENATAVSSDDLSKMSNNGIYLISTGSNKSYMFYGQQCIGGSWKIDEPLVTTGSADVYTITLPYAHTFADGDSILVKFHTPNSGSSSLNGTPIMRQLSNVLTPQALTSGQLKTEHAYQLTYTTVGSNHFWIISAMNKPAWSDLYGKPSNLLSYQIVTSTASVGSATGTAYLILE